MLISALLLPLPLFARCPISPNGTLVLHAEVGNLIVDTSGTDAVEVEVADKQMKVQENCGRDIVKIEGTRPAGNGIPDWKIRVPRTVNLDLVAHVGRITVMGDTDGSVDLRANGPVSAGNIRGRANIVSLTDNVRAGRIDGRAELRSIGNLNVGSVSDRKSTRLNSSHSAKSRMPSSA